MGIISHIFQKNVISLGFNFVDLNFQEFYQKVSSQIVGTELYMVQFSGIYDPTPWWKLFYKANMY